MAAIVEVSQPVMSQGSGDMGQSDGHAKDRSVEEMKKVNTENDKSAKKDGKDNIPKPKIFDNKTFVEAPIPKTNPWAKVGASNLPPVNPNAAPTDDKTGNKYSLKSILYLFVMTGDIVMCCFPFCSHDH